MAGERAPTSPGCCAPNADPHDYEVRPARRQALAGADLVVRSGGELDDWLDDAIDAAGTRAPVLDLADHVTLLDGDPHWWQDPRNAIRAVAALRDALTRADPAGARTYAPQRGGATPPGCERLDRAIAALHRQALRRPSARSSPRTTRSATTRTATGCASSAP